MEYNHTQIGYVIICAVVLVALLFAFTIFTLPSDQINYLTIGFMVVILILVSSFSTLTVTVDDKYLRIKFGYGLFLKRLALKEIASLKAVRNKWYYGWGIRGWFWPYMWIFNVSGLNAVELTMKNGKKFRIGTDEPKKLEYAIRAAKR